MGLWYHNLFDLLKQIPLDDTGSLYEHVLSRPIAFGVAGDNAGGQPRARRRAPGPAQISGASRPRWKVDDVPPRWASGPPMHSLPMAGFTSRRASTRGLGKHVPSSVRSTDTCAAGGEPRRLER